MIISILASTPTGGIGNRGTLPWPKHSEDLAWFKSHTENQIVVMGRNTWDDPLMPKPLPNRTNIVVTNTAIDDPLKARRISGDIPKHIKEIQAQFLDKDIYIIGGKQVYDLCADITERIVLTRMRGDYFADTRIDIGKWLECFRIYSVRPGTNCTYEVWERTIF